MNDASDPFEPWLELAARWQEAAQQWTQWWTRAQGTPLAEDASTSTVAHASSATPPGGTGKTHAKRAQEQRTQDRNAPQQLAGAAIAEHAQDIAALNARYQPRFQALWLGLQQAVLDPKNVQAMPAVAEPTPGDRRFSAPEWSTLPYFALLKQHYLLTSEYLKELAALAPLPPADKRRIGFITRQVVDAMAPTNFAATNPEVWKRALSTEGRSLARGVENLLADARKGRISMTDESAFALGRNLALTPGDVVYRSDLVELIQYRASTAQVHAVPLLMVPPCINKYYILDLQPENSFVRWAVDQGHTVFMVSWRNVPAELGHLTWDDYVQRGVLDVLDVVKAITRSKTVNSLGFCVGGAILACALAVLAARGDRSVASVSFLTTMLDYDDPGEIAVYVSREFLAAREPALMAGQRVHGGELATAFASLRANELVWNYVVNNYLKGNVPPAFDLLYWNSDSSNLPGPMYVYYLRNMYLDNKLREPGALTVLGVPVDLRRIASPAYVYASREDHIVPWRSAYRTTQLVGGESTFTLGASGHIAGVVNPPAQGKRSYWTNPAVPPDPQTWLEGAQEHPGSWWMHWAAWLSAHAGKRKAAPRTAGNARYAPMEGAPGRYVREKAT